MTALSAPRTKFSSRDVTWGTFGFPAKAGKVFWSGALGVLVGGFLQPCTGAAGERVVGVIELKNRRSVDTTGTTDGDVTIECKRGIFPFAIGASTDALVQSDAGKLVYALDDQTVGKTNGGVARPIVGHLFEVSSSQAFVAIGMQLPGGLETVRGGVETVAAAGALSLNTELSLVTPTGTVIYTLADGLYDGQKKYVAFLSGASTPNGGVTPAHAEGFTSVSAIGAVGDCVGFIWDATNTKWAIISANGVTIA